MRTVVHISDVHFGRVDQRTVDPLVTAVKEISPDLVVVSGDLTQRARSEQFEEAARFLERLPGPRIVVPGNHDIPFYNVAARFFSRLRKFHRYITTDMLPTHVDEEIAVVGANTARSLVFKGGRINREQVMAIRERLCPLPDTVTKIVVTHHPFDLPPTFDENDLVGRADMAMNLLSECGADVFLAGHMHIGYTGSTSTRYNIQGYSALVIQAGTATSTRGRGEPNSFNVIRVEHPTITVDRLTWRPEEGSFGVSLSESFHRSEEGWKAMDVSDAGRRSAGRNVGGERA